MRFCPLTNRLKSIKNVNVLLRELGASSLGCEVTISGGVHIGVRHRDGGAGGGQRDENQGNPTLEGISNLNKAEDQCLTRVCHERS